VLGDDALGLGDRLPRSVPWDAVAAVAAHVVPDRLLTQIAALLALTAAGAGAARLARDAGPGRWIALLVAQWNPFVLEQLAVGHVPHLLAYGALPWALLGARDVVRRGPRAAPPLAVALAAGSLTPGGGLLVGIGATVAAAATAMTGGEGLRRSLAVLVGAAALAAQAPWLVAGLLHAPAARAAGPGAAVFATRAETPAGVVVDTLGLGGMWAASAVPASRTTPLALASPVLLLGLAAFGIGPLLAARPRDPLVRAGAVLAVGGYVVALLPHLPAGEALLDAVASTVPGGGILRDGHRWLAWPALALAVLAGHGARRIAARADGAARTRWGILPALVLVGSAVVAVAPDLAWGLSGRLHAGEYPADWSRVRVALDASADGDRVVVLPWQPFRRFAWSGARNVLDPAPRFLPRPTLVDDALTVGAVRLPAEGAASRAVGVALADGVLTADEAAGQGIGWVLVEHGTPGALPALPAGSAVVDGPDLTLVRLPHPPHVPAVPAWQRLCVIGAHLIWLAVLLGGVLGHRLLLLPRALSRPRLLPGSVRRTRT
jgi:hypothetical protein